MNSITLTSESGKKYRFRCSAVLHGIAVDPVLPENFDYTPNDARDDRSRAWWGVPYIETYRSDEPGFLAHYPQGVRYDVRCLDGGAWDRSTFLGAFGTLEAAVKAASELRS